MVKILELKKRKQHLLLELPYAVSCIWVQHLYSCHCVMETPPIHFTICSSSNHVSLREWWGSSYNFFPCVLQIGLTCTCKCFFLESFKFPMDISLHIQNQCEPATLSISGEAIYYWICTLFYVRWVTSFPDAVYSLELYDVELISKFHDLSVR